MYLCICERVAENSSQSRRFRRPSPTRAPGRFNPFLGPRRKVSLSLHGRPWVTFSTHSPSDQFWLLKLCPQNGPLSIYFAGHGWRYIEDAVPIWLWSSVSSHGCTIIAIPACLFPPTLDDSRFPRRDVDGTGEIFVLLVGVNRTTNLIRSRLSRGPRGLTAHVTSVATAVGGPVPLLFLRGGPFTGGPHAAACANRLAPAPRAPNPPESGVPL